ncbi:MAG TPA: transglycosylase SLT domain-containing protein, partial [Polyangiaceae bacterium]|nr:transglycosylase SLT domain-containing protein [Polyangiaceae bacterium]
MTGGLLGGAVEQGGARLEQTGAQLQQTALHIANFYNEANANSAQNQWVDSATKLLYDPETGLYAKRGIDAQKAWPETQAALKLSREQIAANLPNDRQRLMFDQLTRRTYDYHLLSAANHVDQETKQYADAQWKAGIDLNMREASRDPFDEAAFQSNFEQAVNKSEAYARYHGQSQEVIDQQRAELSSKFYSQRTALMAMTSPTEAKKFFDQNQDKIDPNVREQLGRALESKIEDDTATSEVSAYFGAPQGTAGSSSVWDRIKSRESGGRQFDASGKPLVSDVGGDNPVGVSQIRPSTARGQAKLLGIEFDEKRLQTDPQYNEMLGHAYFDQMTQRYGGNLTLASAAYNAGPGRVDGWLAKFGDPRTGTISDSDFASKIPIDETRKYVQAVSAGGSAAPAQPGQMPDRSAFYQRMVEKYGDNPKMLAKVLSKGSQQLSIIEAATQSERNALSRDQENMQKAL